MMYNSLSGFTSAQVIKQQAWSDTLFSISLKAANVEFQAGQFVKLALFDANGELVKRAYSVVNHPQQYQKSGELEFLIVTVPEGRLSPLLHQRAIGDQVYVSQQGAGFMTLDEIPIYARELWLLSTGTAIGPFLSLLQDEKIALRFNRLVLVHAVRYSSDWVYQEIIHKLTLRYPGKFIYVPIVSREQVAGHLSGRIPELLKGGELEKYAGINLKPEESFIYLCGNPQMIRDTSDRLKDMGYHKHLRRKAGHFSSENYW